MIDNDELRKRAEEMTPDMEAPSPENIGTLSPEETRRMLHELRVHQIELEMQNDELRRAQTKLDAARARYYDFYNLAPVGYCSISEQGQILEANPIAAALLGAPRSALIKQPITRFVCKEYQDICYLHTRRLFKTNEPQAYDLRMTKENGAEFWVHLAATAAQDADGLPVCRIVLSDITERKFREDEYELTSRLIIQINTPGDFRERMSDLTACLQGWSGCEAVGIRLRDGDDYPYYETRGFPPAFVQAEKYLCAYGPDGKILRDGTGNPVLECMCGNVLCGRFDSAKPFFTNRGSFWTNSTTALLSSTTEADRQARTRNRCNGMGYESVALIPLCAGDQVFGLLQFNDLRPDRFTPDRIAHFEKMADNLAIALLQRQTVEMLRDSEERFRLIAETITEVFWLADTHIGTMLYISPAYEKVWGRSVASLYENPRSFIDAIHVADRELVAADLIVKKDMQPFEHEYRIVRPDGDIRWICDRGFPVRNVSGQVTQYVGIAQDITNLKRAVAETAKLQAQLLHAQKMEAIGSLAGGIAHDLNNILFPISGLSEMLLEQIPQDSPEHESLKQIHKSAQRGSDLVKQILAFSRQSNPRKLPIRIQPILKEVLQLSMATIPANIEITSSIDKDCGMVSADPTQVHQILMNLITNAYHAVEHTGGTIHAALKASAIRSSGEKADMPFHAKHGDFLADGYACITVSDTGCGIDKLLIDKIFQPYFTTKALGKGTGLGLSVVHGIVKEHGGDIRVYSDAGKGTVFHVYLPLLEDTGNSKARTDARDYPTGSESILLVDDEAQIAHIEQMMLERLGYRITVRTSSPDALDTFRADPSKFDLVISDRGMPNMTGEQLAGELIAIRPEIPVIICTGFCDETDERRARAMGVKGFLMKPVATGDLAVMVRKVLDAASDIVRLSAD